MCVWDRVGGVGTSGEEQSDGLSASIYIYIYIITVVRFLVF